MISFLPQKNKLALSFIALTSAVVLPQYLYQLPAGAVLEKYQEYTRAGEEAFANNNYGQAEKNFVLALQEAESSPVKDMRLANALKNMATLYDMRGQFAKSEPLWEKELHTREKILGGEHPQVVASVGKLIRFYLAHNKLEKAEKLTVLLNSFADRISQETITLNSQMEHLHQFFKKHPEYKQCETDLNKLQDSTRKIVADDHLELAAILDGVALAYKEKGKTQPAEQLLKHALALREKTLPPGHLALAHAYENLGKLYSAQGKENLAEPLYKKSLAITEKSLDIKRPEFFSRLQKLAQSQINMGNNSEAEALYKKGLLLLEKNGSTTSGDYSALNFALGALYLKSGRAAAAEALLKKSVALAEAGNGPQSANLLPILEAYAETMDKIGKNVEATKIRTRIASIRGVVNTGNNTADF